MAGKYQKLRGKVAKFELEQGYQEKINEWKSTHIGDNEIGNVRFLADAFAIATARKKEAEARLSEINLELTALSQVLVEHLETEAVQKVELSSGALVYLQDTPYPSVVDKPKLFDWIKRNKLVNLLTAHHQMLKGLVGERLVKGQPPPPGVAVFLKTEARVRSGKSTQGEENGEE